MEKYKPISEFFVDAMQANPVATEDGLKLVLRAICSRFGLSHVTYFGRSIPTRSGFGTVLLTTYPDEWVSRYFEKKYQEIDPVVACGIASLLPIQWSKLPRQDKSVRNLFGEASEFGVGRQGITVSVRGLRSDYALMSFNRDCGDAEWLDFSINSMSDLNYLAYLFHSEVINVHADDCSTLKPKLTGREAETLLWAARGKTAWETAKILGLSEKTVNFHTSNACAKLGVATKTQAVATVVAKRLILL